jgi:hypothetical protein
VSSAQLANRAGCDILKVKAACNWLCRKGFIKRTHRIVQQKSVTHIPQTRSHRQKIVFWSIEATGTSFVTALDAAGTGGVLSGLGL